MLSAHRYVAYTSDIGESFRPVAHPYLVRSAYGISWAYIAGDVGYEGYKAYIRNQKIKHPEKYEDTLSAADRAAPEKSEVQKLGKDATTQALVAGKVAAIDDYRTVMAQRAVFQSIASMGLPAFTIHSIVKYSGRAMKDMKNKTVRTWGPIGVSDLLYV
jgi:mitochondrial fission process protein 1